MSAALNATTILPRSRLAEVLIFAMPNLWQNPKRSAADDKDEVMVDCPLCKSPFKGSSLKPYTNKLITRGLAELMVFCSQAGLGCKW